MAKVKETKTESPMIENYNHLKKMIVESETDVTKNAEKGNYVAGQRFRKVIKEARNLLTELKKQSLESSKNNQKEN